MFVAQIHHKLTRQEEDKEDLLTSNVFGLWRYLRPPVGLTQFLNTAKGINGEYFYIPSEIEINELQFWPSMQEANAKGAEADVLMQLSSSNQRKWLILIESKYLSGKSSLADDTIEQPNDQLAREMHNLRIMASRKGISEYAVIYVTADTLIPSTDILEAVEELTSKTGKGDQERFYWTTWRHIPDIISSIKSQCEGPSAVLLGDLGVILEQMGLTFFRGIVSRGWSLGEVPFVFRRPIGAFDWKVITDFQYKFGVNS